MPIDITDIARIAHEANRAYCAVLGDNSQPPWNEAPLWQRESAIAGVVLHINNPETSPSASHDAWYAEKERTGWVYGPVKDPVLQTHPCMVAFEELPIDQQRKDYLFAAIVHALTPLLVDDSAPVS